MRRRLEEVQRYESQTEEDRHHPHHMVEADDEGLALQAVIGHLARDLGRGAHAQFQGRGVQLGRPQAQGEGGYWPRWTTQERSLDLQGSVDQAKAQLRAFGGLDCVAPVSGALMYVSRATAWCSR